ncbi:hypothetical protein [Micromonospora sp. DH14]|uniref:hypothetical protein n=1 Tax=Micromonospora sp. DH14 TaxID=3040120 RepID=UPI002441FDAC|nr:hypothetical protein [Micromonospora sp. DH14]MDG9679081.1 hypothetical protein [Micromonospora sp. DH14]
MPANDDKQLDQVPFEPQEREIHRLLGLMGGAPAAQYADAIRILRGTPPLQTRSHLLGHMAREIESALRELLGALIPSEKWAELEALKPPERRDPEAALVIDAICSALGLDEADSVRELWRKSGKWHDVAHRGALLAPRPADDVLVERWLQLEALLKVVLRSYEAVFVRALPVIDELAAADPVTNDHVSRLLNRVPNSTPALGRFFDRATPAWFPKLRGKGYFRSPPPLQANEDGYVVYQQWPPGRYLTRIARDPNLAQDVVDVVLALDTDNPEAAETVADVALAVPAELARPLAAKIAQLLESPAQWRLPSRAVELLPVFVADGQQDHAAAVLAALLPAPTRRGSRGGYLPADVVSQIFPAMGVPGVTAIASRLAQKAADTRDDLTDSRLWWPDIASSQALGARDHLVTMLRDAAASVAAQSGPAPVVRVLEAYPDGIFRRLALHVLLLAPDPKLVAARLTDTEAFHDRESFVEYGALLRAHFAELLPGDRERILRLIDQGPANREDPAAVERWRTRQLARFGDALPERYQTERAALIGKLGEPDVTNRGVVFTSRSDVLALSSTPLAALDPMTDDHLITYLADWVPTGKWEDPDVSELRQQIVAAAGRNPRRFAALAPRFVDLDPTYARGLFAGLRQAINAAQASDDSTTSILDWPPVLSFGATAMSQPRLLPGRPEYGDGERDPGWAWTRQELAELLTVGVRRDIPTHLLDQAFELIVRLLEDPDPIVRDDAEADSSSLLTTAINSVRGNALLALLQYAIRRHDPARPILDPAISRLLDRHLDTTFDPSSAIRSLYGEKIHILAGLDEAWTRRRISQIFPHTTEPGVASAAWDAYLRFSWPSPLTAQLLAPMYEQHLTALSESSEVDSHTDGPREDQPEDRIIQHLAILYQHGAISLNSESFANFLDHAPLRLRARLIEVIGEQLHGSDRLDQAEVDRLKVLWTRQLDAARQPGGDLAQLAGFGHWFSSGALPDDWALRQLIDALATGATLTPCHDIAERLAALRPESPHEVVVAIAAIIESPDEPWFITGSRDDIAAVLHDGLRSPDLRTQRLARETISRLVARGYTNFTDPWS